MGGSSTFIISIVLLFVGTLAAIIQLKSRSRTAESANIVPLPMIGGGSLKRGPWPGCLGISGSECSDLITSYTELEIQIDIVTPEMVELLADDFDVHRVRIFVDDDAIVTKIPVRGN